MTDRPADFEAVARDDQMLDVLARGGRPGGNDPVIQALYAWRAELSAGIDEAARPVDGVRPADGVAPAIGVARVNGVRPAIVKPGIAPDQDQPAVRSKARRRAAVAAVLVGLSAGFGGVAVAAADAQPGSPLWPITKVIYADTAADRQATADVHAALSKARRALAEGRTNDAERYLDEASRRAAAADPKDADALRHEVAAVRARLDERKKSGGSGDGSPSPSPSGSGTPSVSPSLPSPSPSASASGGKDDSGKHKPSPPGGRDKDSRLNTQAEETAASLLLPDATSVTGQIPGF
jgi:hypothetical protein